MMRISALILSLAICSPASAMDQDWGVVQGWQVFEASDQSYCALSMSYEGKGSTELTYAIKLDNSIVMTVTNTGWSAKKEEIYEITLSFDDVGYDVSAIGVGNYSSKGFGIGLNVESGTKVTEQLAKSTGLEIYLGDQLVDDLSLRGTGAAIQRANACLAKLRRVADAEAKEKARLEHIPDDPFGKQSTETAVTQTPESKARSAQISYGSIYSWDYPNYALREKMGGAVTIELTIDRNSYPIKCKIKSSSGHAKLDDDTCKLAAKRFIFRHALDEQGNPTEGLVEKTITWKLPPDDPPPPPPLEIEH